MPNPLPISASSSAPHHKPVRPLPGVTRSTLWITLICVAIVASLVSYFVGRVNGRAELGNIIALKKIPHTTAPNLNGNYTAIVWTEPEESGLGVFARITIGGSFGAVEYMQDVGRLGTATSHADAVERFGEVTWDETAVFIGSRPGPGRRISRSQLQQHR